MKKHIRYGKLTPLLLAQLTAIVGEKHILITEGKENYSRDEEPNAQSYPPEAVVKPADPAEVARILSFANEYKIPVTPRGAGTGLSGGSVPIFGGLVLSTERMNKVLEIDDANFTAHVESGTLLSDLYPQVETRGLYYPLYPGETSATLGGNVSTNAGGMRAVKYGVTRNFVLGLEAVLPTGEIIQTGGKYIKSATGYDLTHLLIGSEGTLAVITKVLLKLITPPGLRELLFIPFRNLKDAIRCVPAILKEKILPVGIEFMEKDIIEMVEKYTGKEIPLHDYAAYLLLIIEADNSDQFYQIAERLESLCSQCGAVDIFVPGSESAKRNLLEAREKFYTVISHYGILDIADTVVPRSRIADFVEKAKAIGNRYGTPIVAYGHAGDGNVHLHPLGREDVLGRDKIKEMLSEIYRAGIEMGGTISGEHGLGFAKKGFLELVTPPAKLELLKRVKLAFDPHNILNPGKILDF